MSQDSTIIQNVEGNDYSVGPMDAMTQFHVARRIAPAQQAMGTSILELMRLGQELSGDMAMLAISKPVVDVVAKMSDADVEYVIKACLACVHRRPAGAETPWAPLTVGGRLQFADVQMPLMTRLTMEVLKARFGSFFGQLLAAPTPETAS